MWNVERWPHLLKVRWPMVGLWPGHSNLFNSHLPPYSNVPTFTLHNTQSPQPICTLDCIVKYAVEVYLELITCSLCKCFDSICKAFSSFSLKCCHTMTPTDHFSKLPQQLPSAASGQTIQTDITMMDRIEAALKVYFTPICSHFVNAGTKNMHVRCQFKVCMLGMDEGRGL